MILCMTARVMSEVGWGGVWGGGGGEGLAASVCSHQELLHIDKRV